MNNYIIKNCPATTGTNGFCGDDRKELFCQDCTNCLLKRIVEKCKQKAELLDYTAIDILSMLEIEECE